MAFMLNRAVLCASGLNAVRTPPSAPPSWRSSSMISGESVPRSTSVSIVAEGRSGSSSECWCAAIGSTGSMLTMSRPDTGNTCQVSISAGPSAARAAATSRPPSPRSGPHQQPRSAAKTRPRKASGTVGSGGNRRNATADVIASGSVRFHSAQNASTSRARSTG